MTERQRPKADFTLSDDLGVIAVLVVREGRFPWYEGRLYEVREDRREALQSREGVTHESSWEIADGTTHTGPAFTVGMESRRWVSS